jgi:hypothetical protein
VSARDSSHVGTRTGAESAASPSVHSSRAGSDTSTSYAGGGGGGGGGGSRASSDHGPMPMGGWTTPADDATRYSGKSMEFLSSGFFRSNMPPGKIRGKPRIPKARQAALSRAALLDHYHHNELVMPLRCVPLSSVLSRFHPLTLSNSHAKPSARATRTSASTIMPSGVGGYVVQRASFFLSKRVHGTSQVGCMPALVGRRVRDPPSGSHTRF